MCPEVTIHCVNETTEEEASRGILVVPREPVCLRDATATPVIIVFMMDPVGPMVQRNLNHKCCHFAPPCGAVYCQGLKVFQ